MQDVNIYIAGTIHGPAKKAGGYLYILECFRGGQAVTLEKSVWMENATENQLALTALGEALGRINCPCSLRIYTDCQHIIHAMRDSWARQWQKNGWRNAKGKAVKNADLWQKVLEQLDTHLYTFTDEPHTYSQWMKDELEREGEKHG